MSYFYLCLLEITKFICCQKQIFCYHTLSRHLVFLFSYPPHAQGCHSLSKQRERKEKKRKKMAHKRLEEEEDVEGSTQGIYFLFRIFSVSFLSFLFFFFRFKFAKYSYLECSPVILLIYIISLSFRSHFHSLALNKIKNNKTY